MALAVPDVRLLPELQMKMICDLSDRRWLAKGESRELAELRDTLLPHLRSGRITVRDVARQVEAAL